MKSNELRPGDVIRVVLTEYQVVTVDPFNGNLVVRDLLGREARITGEFVDYWMEKSAHA